MSGSARTELMFTGLAAVVLLWAYRATGQNPTDLSTAPLPGAKNYAEYSRLYDLTGGKLDERHLASLRKAAEEGNYLAQAQYGVFLISKQRNSRRTSHDS